MSGYIRINGRNVSRRWLSQNGHTPPAPKSALRPVTDPGLLVHVRAIVNRIDTPIGENLRKTLVAIIDELHQRVTKP